MTRLFKSGESLTYPTQEEYLDSISVDCVIFSFHEGEIKVLLNKLLKSENWMLPGGFVRVDENVNDAACRVLNIRTGLDDVFLKQFHLFGECNRLDFSDNKKFIEDLNMDADVAKWYLRRFVTMGYYALVEYTKVNLNVYHDVEELEWFSLNKLPNLYSDHRHIIDGAISSIRIQLGYVPVGFQLLPEKFTMPELRMVYEAIIGKELDRRNFQRKMLSVGLITKLEEKRKAGAHKAPYLYSFNKDRYAEAERSGMYLMSWSSSFF